MRAAAVVACVALAGLLSFGANAGALPTRPRPPRTVTLTVTYFVNGSYTNSFDGGGQNYENCESGNESASFAIKLGYARVKFRLASGASETVLGSDFGTGQWSEVGAEWNTVQQGFPCSYPGATAPLNCSGRVGTRAGPAGLGQDGSPGGRLTVFVNKRMVYLAAAANGAGEEGASACGTREPDGYSSWVTPLLGLTETLAPWTHVYAVLPLATLAAQHHHATLRLHVVPKLTSPSWNPSTCDGRNGSPGIVKCVGALAMTGSGLTVQIG